MSNTRLRKAQLDSVTLLTAVTTLVEPKDVQANTTLASFTITLPSSGVSADGDKFKIYRDGSWETNNLFVAPGAGTTLAGAGTTLGYGDMVKAIEFIRKGTDWTINEIYDNPFESITTLTGNTVLTDWGVLVIANSPVDFTIILPAATLANMRKTITIKNIGLGKVAVQANSVVPDVIFGGTSIKQNTALTYESTGAAVIHSVRDLSADGKATLIDSTTAAQTIALSAATGSGSFEYYVNKAITNAATFTVPLGGYLNGVLNGVFYASNYGNGSQFVVTDYATNKWAIAVEGDPTQTSLAYFSAAVSSAHPSSSVMNSTLTSVTGTGYGAEPLTARVNLSPAGWVGSPYSSTPVIAQSITAGANNVTITQSGRYRIGVSLVSYDNIQSGPSYHRVQIYKNNNPIRAVGVSNSVNAATVAVPLATETIVDLLVGDTIDIRGGHSNSTVFTVTSFSLVIEQLPVAQAVLAGMVVPTPLALAQIARSGTDSGTAAYTIAIASGGTVSATAKPTAQRLQFTSAHASIADTITVGTNIVTITQAGRYNISAAVSMDWAGGAAADWVLEATKNGAIIAWANTTTPTFNFNEQVLVSTVVDLVVGDVIDFRMSGSQAQTANIYAQTLSIQQVAKATVVNPGSVPVIDLSYVRYWLPFNAAATSFATAPGTRLMQVMPNAEGTIPSDGSDLIITQAGRYRFDWLLLAPNTELNDDGEVHVVVNGVSVKSVFYDMNQSSGVNQTTGTMTVDLQLNDLVSLRYAGNPTADTIAWGKGSYFQVQQIAAKSIITPGSIGQLVGATASVAGTAGYAPAPVAGDQKKYLSGGGAWAGAFMGGVIGTAGDMGLVPAPGVSDQYARLNGDGTWKDATLLRVQQVSNMAANGVFGTSAVISAFDSLFIIQVTAGITATLPNPTDTTVARVVEITNSVSSLASITIAGRLLLAGNTAQFFWNPTDLSWSVLNPIMTGAGAATTGTSGFVTAPASGQNNARLYGDGLWRDTSKMRPLSVGNVPANGNMTTVANIDAFDFFALAQTSANITATIPSPTDTATARTIYVGNATTGTQNLTVNNRVIKPGQVQQYIYSTTDNFWYPGGNVMNAATSTTAGGTGLVPAPVAGNQYARLHGDAQWKNFTPMNAVVIGNVAANGALTTAANMNAFDVFTLAQTTAGVTLTLTAPTDTVPGRVITVRNLQTATTSVTVTGVEIPAGTAAQYVWNAVAWTPVANRTPNVQRFTVGGTYTPSLGMRYCIAEAWGGGAAGGGAPASTASNATVGSGGGSGAYGKAIFTDRKSVV